MAKHDIEPQLVLLFSKEAAKKHPQYEGKMFFWKRKKDGWYGYVDCVDGRVDGFFTRTGNRIETLRNQFSELVDFFSDVFKYAGIQNGRLIMEIRDKEDKAKFLSEINSILKKQKIQQECSFHVHTLVNFDKRVKMWHMWLKLKNAWDEATSRQPKTEHVYLLKNLVVTDDIDEVLKVYENEVANGEEGLVGYYVDGHYEPGKRWWQMMKIKAEKVIEGCEIIDMQPGLGNGNLIVRLPSGVEARVAGINNDQAKRWTKANILGKIIDIACMSLTKEGKPREPRLWKCKL